MTRFPLMPQTKQRRPPTLRQNGHLAMVKVFVGTNSSLGRADIPLPPRGRGVGVGRAGRVGSASRGAVGDAGEEVVLRRVPSKVLGFELVGELALLRSRKTPEVVGDTAGGGKLLFPSVPSGAPLVQ